MQLKLNWYWGFLGLLGFLGLNDPVYYAFFAFFLFFLEPVFKKCKNSRPIRKRRK